ncbi:MAG: HAD family hydrolase [Myxococcales bacterium]
MAAKAAFFDVDGTLVSTNIVHAFGYYAMNEGSLRSTALRTAGTLFSAPLLWGLDRISRKGFNELFYRYYRGMSEDRLRLLASELFEDVLKDAVYPGAWDLVAEAKRGGCRVVFVTGALDFTMEKLAQHLGADDLIANQMQFANGAATGRVVPPIIEGANKAHRIREYCVKHALRLDHSFAYSDSASDYPMLAVVGRPTAVNPDLKLRSLARSYEWPILDLR